MTGRVSDLLDFQKYVELITNAFCPPIIRIVI